MLVVSRDLMITRREAKYGKVWCPLEVCDMKHNEGVVLRLVQKDTGLPLLTVYLDLVDNEAARVITLSDSGKNMYRLSRRPFHMHFSAIIYVQLLGSRHMSRQRRISARQLFVVLASAVSIDGQSRTPTQFGKIVC
jgi:hypothetical protein